MTGKYPIHTGMQHGVILEPEPWGLPLSEKILPQHLEPLGYESHIVGKWHLGFYKKEYTPVHRGFKSHYGFWNGYQDYYNHTVQASFVPYEGYDMRRNDNIDWSGIGKYSTDLFTEESIKIIENHNKSKSLFLYFSHLAPHAGNYEDPLQAPEHVIQTLSHIYDPERRKYAAMVVKLDESVGKIVTALRRANMIQNSIIVVLSDNGAATEGIHANKGSNWPLKGEKLTPWEGGIRTVASIWSPMLSGERVSSSLFHISDWLPTLFSAAGGDVKELGVIDGINQWKVFSEGASSLRNEILHNIDEITGYAAIRIRDYKFVNGTVLLGFLDKWTGESMSCRRKYYNTTAVLNSEVSDNLVRIGFILPTYEKMISLRKQSTINCGKKKYTTCLPFKNPCLFDIKHDPCEVDNIYDRVYNLSDINIKTFESHLNYFRKTAVKPGNKMSSKYADPKLYNNTWVNWGDYCNLINKKN
ncbi:arylsulfatase J-like isoform X2 [Lycorma delicatula]